MKRSGWLTLKWSGWLILGCASLLALQCNISPPAAPSWDVELNVPLINKLYTLSEFIEGIEGLKLDSLGNLSVEFETEIDTFDVYGKLYINGISQQFSQKVGSFSIQSPGSQSLDVTLKEIYPASEQLNGTRVAIPAFNFQVPTQELPPFEALAWVEIESGYIDLTIQNNLPFDLGKPIEISIIDASADTSLASWSFSDFIPPQQAQTSRLDLSGKRISGRLAISIIGASPGSSQPVLVNTADGFSVLIEMSDLTVTGAAARLDPQTIDLDETMKISDSVVVKQASIRSGTLTAEISGNLPLDAEVSFTLPDFVNQNGEPLAETFTLLQNQTNRLIINLSGYTFSPEGEDFGEQLIRLKARAITSSSQGNIVELMSTDSIFARFEISDIYFSEISGRFYQKNIEIPQQSISIDLPEDVKGIKFEAASVTIELYNSIAFPAYIYLMIKGRNDAGETEELIIEETILAGKSNGQAVKSVIALDQDNSNITRLLNLLPTQIEVSGYADLGRSDFIGLVQENDFITGKARFVAPAVFQIPKQELKSDTVEIKIQEDTRKRIEQNLQAGQLIARLKSSFPVGAKFLLNFALDNNRVFTQPDLQIGPVEIQMPEIDPNTQTAVRPAESDIKIALDREDILFFTNPLVYHGLVIQLPGTQNQPVRLLGSDFVDIKAYLNLNIRVQEEQNN